MKCLSLKQPFAELLASGRKTIELRSWNTRFRGQFLIHASQNVDLDACSTFGIDPSPLIKGVIIGKAILYDVKKYENQKEFLSDQSKHMATSDYVGSKYGFLVKDAVRLKKPIYIPGRLGFFEVTIPLG